MPSTSHRSIFHEIAAYLPGRRVSAETTVSRYALEKAIESGAIRTTTTRAGRVRVHVDDLARLFPDAQLRAHRQAVAVADTGK
jgi:ribosomal protein L17